LAVNAFADEVTIPKYIVLSDPTTNVVDRFEVALRFGPPAFGILTYFVMDSQGRIVKKVPVKVQNIPDNPESITANCVAENDPWPLCTGAGTCDNDCNEADPRWTTFYNAIDGATIKSEAQALMWEDVQNRFTLQDNP